MIQRKQTVFLFLAMVAMALGFFFPILGIDGENGKEDLLFNLCAQGTSIEGSILLFISMLAAFLCDGVAIFQYKARKRQMLIVNASSIILVLWYVLLLTISVDWSEVRLYHWGISSVLPLVSIILNALAYKGVKHDENLIRSMDRIR